jgi:membrane protease YdiL (CAAX protease family)
LQVLFGLFGIGLGYIEYLILRPAPLVGVLTLGQIWLPALILIIFTGILEELVFRGLMQAAFTKKFGPWLTNLLVSLLFAVLHLGYGSLPDMVFVFVVAVLFGLVTRWTGSIIGVSLAHGLTNVTLFLIFPFIVG